VELGVRTTTKYHRQSTEACSQWPIGVGVGPKVRRLGLGLGI
jgi:hypothetical protein